jgi:hypothetical protein
LIVKHASSILDYMEISWPWLAGRGADRLVNIVYQLQSEPRWTVRVRDLRMDMNVFTAANDGRLMVFGLQGESIMIGKQR